MSDAAPTNRILTEGEPTGEMRIISAPSPTTVTGQHPALRLRAPGGKTRMWSVLGLVAASLVSFFAVGQLREPDRFEQQLSTESEGDLARILASLSSESSALQQELGSLKVELANLRSSSQAEGSAAAEASAQLNALRVLSGAVAVTGPGLEIVIDDPNNAVRFDIVVDTVQELRDAGAEAITVSGRRVGASSSFGQSGGRVVLDGTPLSMPYTIGAIGPADTMEGGLQIPGGALDSLRALNGVRADVHRSTSLSMPALEVVPVFHAARPIGSQP